MKSSRFRQLDLGVDFLIAFFGDDAVQFAEQQRSTSRTAGTQEEIDYWEDMTERTAHRLERMGRTEGLSEGKRSHQAG